MTVVLGIFVVLIILFAIWLVAFKLQQNEYRDFDNDFNQGLELIREGKYDEGLAICNDFMDKYFTTVGCHGVVLGVKLSNNETITKEFCNSFPTEYEENLPWALKIFISFESPNRAENFEKQSLAFRQQCYSYVSS